MKKFRKDDITKIENAIPKKIHFVWVGGAEKSELCKKCIESWKMFMPEYELIEWNETNFDMNCCDYIKEAYDAGKWAFVSDAMRTYILKEYGGIYFDTDVELFAKPQGIFDIGEVVLGFDNKFLLSTGVLATVPHHKIFETLWDKYKKIHFVNSDIEETINTKLTFIVMDYIKKRRITNGEYLIGNVKIYPTKYFSDNTITSQVFAVHHFTGTWKRKTELTFWQYIVFVGKFRCLRVLSLCFMGNKSYIRINDWFWREALEKTTKNKKNKRKIYKIL